MFYARKRLGELLKAAEWNELAMTTIKTKFRARRDRSSSAWHAANAQPPRTQKVEQALAADADLAAHSQRSARICPRRSWQTRHSVPPRSRDAEADGQTSSRCLDRPPRRTSFNLGSWLVRRSRLLAAHAGRSATAAPSRSCYRRAARRNVRERTSGRHDVRHRFVP